MVFNLFLKGDGRRSCVDALEAAEAAVVGVEEVVVAVVEGEGEEQVIAAGLAPAGVRGADEEDEEGEQDSVIVN